MPQTPQSCWECTCVRPSVPMPCHAAPCSCRCGFQRWRSRRHPLVVRWPPSGGRRRSNSHRWWGKRPYEHQGELSSARPATHKIKLQRQRQLTADSCQVVSSNCKCKLSLTVSKASVRLKVKSQLESRYESRLTSRESRHECWQLHLFDCLCWLCLCLCLWLCLWVWGCARLWSVVCSVLTVFYFVFVYSDSVP